MKTPRVIARILTICLFCLINGGFLLSGQSEASEIIRKSDEKSRGISSKAELSMKIIRPTWEREVHLKSWSKGDDYSLILITDPARDKGISFLKRDKEMWNWQPRIDRVIKLPPSMMSQSWMGSDFSNDDLIKHSSIVDDYEHHFLPEEFYENRSCYVIELLPKKDIPVVWDRVVMWIDKKELLQLKTLFYDEEGYLISSILGKEIKMIGNRVLPSILEVIPEDEEGHKTVIEYLTAEFDFPIDTDFFSVRNMKRIR